MAEHEQTMTTRLDIQNILKILPHRYPFLLVDRVTEYEPFKFIKAFKNVTVNEPCFMGHFPEQPIFPGVLIVEAMAQTGGLLAGLCVDTVDKDHVVYFLSIDKVKFRKPVIPGDRMHLELTVIQRRRQVWKFEARALVDGALVAEAQLTAMTTKEVIAK